MTNRRRFIQMTAAASAIHALPAESSNEKIPHKAWVLSDVHCGYTEGGKDGAAWFTAACEDMQKNVPAIARAMTLGDITHGGGEPQLKSYLTARDASGIKTWHEVAGNHEYHGPTAAAYIKLIRSTDPYTVIEGNIVWIFLSDQKAGVAGELLPETCDWLEKELSAHKGKNIIVCSHQGVKGTTFRTDKADRHLHPADRIAAIIATSEIALWMSGHEHHTPYSPQHIARVGDTTFLNVASLSHAYKTGSSQSTLLEFTAGETQLTARRREHDTQTFLAPYEVKIPLRYPIALG
jgi:hypothetical protein